VEGVAGELFKDLSLAVAFSLLTSLLVALTLLPSLASRFGSGTIPGTSRAKGAAFPAIPSSPSGGIARALLWVVGLPIHLVVLVLRSVLLFFRFMLGVGGYWIGLLGKLLDPVGRGFDRFFDSFAARYHRVLAWSLDRPAWVGVIAISSLGTTAFVGLSMPRNLLPEVDQGSFRIRLEMEEGTALASTLEAAVEVEGAVHADNDVDVVFSTIGRDVRAYAEGDEGTGLHTADLNVRLKEGRRTAPVANRMRQIESRLPAGDLSVETGQATALGAILGGTEADIAVRVFAEDLDLAYGVAEDVVGRLQGVGSIGNVRLGSEQGQPELQIDINHEACASFGISPQQVSDVVETAMRGTLATEFVDFDRRIRVVVRYPEELRYSRSTIDELTINGIPIRELITVQEAVGPAEVRRQNQGRVVPVYADVIGGGLDGAIQDVRAVLDDIRQSPRLRWEVGGENEEMRRSFRDLSFAFLLALVLVYMILAAQFESFVQPLTILVAVPLALIGAVALLAMTGNGLNTMSLIGIVILVGIVVNDAIIKVDFINQARHRGVKLRDAVLEAGRVRLRPIVMTTVTTVLGLVPMALGIGRGSDLRAPMAIAVIGGLILATALTLIVVPVVYETIQRIRDSMSRTTPAALANGAPLPGTDR